MCFISLTPASFHCKLFFKKWFFRAGKKTVVRAPKAKSYRKVTLESDIFALHANNVCSFKKEPFSLAKLSTYYSTDKLSDVVLVVNGIEYRSHKIILSARSRVFDAMFEFDMQENVHGRVEIDDVRSDVFELVLEYIYTGNVAQMEPYTKELLVFADKFQMDPLKTACEEHLSSNLTDESILELLNFATIFSADLLKAKCLFFLQDKAFKKVRFINTKLWFPSCSMELFLEAYQTLTQLADKLAVLDQSDSSSNEID